MVGASLYDQVPYDCRSYPESHVDRLEVIGRMFGMDPAPVERARVLELGCGSGGNLIPMAFHLPTCDFVGIDLSATQIDSGREIVGELELSNVELIAANVCNYKPSGEFDYIIAHGLYSWVPPNVAQEVLALSARHLSRGGVFYVSYNTYPGWHARGGAREMLRNLVPSELPPLEKVAQLRRQIASLAKWSEQSGANQPWAVTLAEELRVVNQSGDDYLLHGILSEHNHPCYFEDMVKRAEAVGLKYLSEAVFDTVDVGRVPPEARAELGQLPSFEAVQQRIDYLLGTTFRRSLFCRADSSVDRRLNPERIRNCWVASNISAIDGTIDLSNDSPLECRTAGGNAITARHPLHKAAMLELRKESPLTMSVSALLESLCVRFGITPDEQLRLNLCAFLTNAFILDVIELRSRPLNIAATVDGPAHISKLARVFARHGNRVPNARHESVELLSDELALVKDSSGSIGDHHKVGATRSVLERLRRRSVIYSPNEKG